MLKHVVLSILVISLITLLVLGIAATTMRVRTYHAVYGSNVDLVMVDIDDDRATLWLSISQTLPIPTSYENVECFKKIIETVLMFDPVALGDYATNLTIRNVKAFVVDARLLSILKTFAGYPSVVANRSKIIDRIVRKYTLAETTCITSFAGYSRRVWIVVNVKSGSSTVSKSVPLRLASWRSQCVLPLHPSNASRILLAIEVDLRRSKLIDTANNRTLNLKNVLLTGNATMVFNVLSLIESSTMSEFHVKYLLVVTMQQIYRAIAIVCICAAILCIYYYRRPEELEPLLRIFRRFSARRILRRSYG